MEFPSNIEKRISSYRESRIEAVDAKIQTIRKHLNKCESPAEQLLLVEMIRELDARPIFGAEHPNHHFAAFPRLGPGTERFIVRIHPQQKLEVDHRGLLRESKNYRADFMLSLERPEQRDNYELSVHAKLVIEVDGHNYHERTKEQAKRDRLRDRMLTQADYIVFRYTGSEVYNESKLVASEICSFVGQKAAEIAKVYGP